jgi:hypothetical protein
MRHASGRPRRRPLSRQYRWCEPSPSERPGRLLTSYDCERWPDRLLRGDPTAQPHHQQRPLLGAQPVLADKAQPLDRRLLARLVLYGATAARTPQRGAAKT